MPDRFEERADLMIRDAFRSTVRPAPSLHFDRRLRVALVEHKRLKRAARIRMRWLQAYWLVTGLAAVWIMVVLPWSEAPGGAWLPLLTAAAMAVLPMVLTRVDLVDLIIDSAANLRDHT